MATRFFSFPNPVNEVAARVVAGGVLLLALTTIITQQTWLILPLTYGFLARVLSGPRFSPLGQLATRLIVPRLPFTPRYVAGPPKRFAQGIGLLFSFAALLLAFPFGQAHLAFILLAVLALFATLESVFAFCAGCTLFALLMRWGIIPATVCAECANIWARPEMQRARQSR